MLSLLTLGVAIATLNAECVKVKHWMKDWAETPTTKKNNEFLHSVL